MVGTVIDGSTPPDPEFGDEARPRGKSVTSKALAVLGAFDRKHRNLTLTEIARRAELPLATTHRFVAELAHWKALERLPDGSYEIGARLWGLGTLSQLEGCLREAAAPAMADLFACTGENVHLAVREGTDALYIDKIRGSRSVPIVSGTGTALPLHATGVGKVLLAWAPDAVRDEVMTRLTRVTPFTITEPDVLHRDLVAVRTRGWAMTTEEMTLGSWSVAAPIRWGGAVVAAVGIVGASQHQDLGRCVTALLATARGTQERLRRFDNGSLDRLAGVDTPTG